MAALSLAAVLFGCGGSTALTPEHPANPQSPPPNAGETAPQTTAGSACFELANAQREHRADEPQKISVKHILVQHTESSNAREGTTRTREQACLRAIEARDKVREGADFDAMVAEYSDEPGAAGRNGLIPDIERNMLVAPFADAAFELDVGQLSDIVETKFGFHVIIRTR